MVFSIIVKIIFFCNKHYEHHNYILKIKANIDEIKPKRVKIVAISKTFDLNHIKPLIDHDTSFRRKIKFKKLLVKRKEIKNHQNLKLHMVGKIKQ